MTTLADLHAEADFLTRYGLTPAYVQKQLHRLPEMPLIDREPYLMARCRDQRVLDLGCASGSLHAKLASVASSIACVDQEPCGHAGGTWFNLDDYEAVRAWEPPAVEVIVMGEILEHLCNPGYLLQRLATRGAALILSTPNAHGRGGFDWLARGYENVHADHTAYYSYMTLSGLLHKTGWQPVAWAQYLTGLPARELPGFLQAELPVRFRGHEPPFAEGWVVAATPLRR